MNNRVLHKSGIQPDILAKFKEIFPEHADIEEYLLHAVATGTDRGPTRVSSSTANQNNSARSEQAEPEEALATSSLQAQNLPLPETPVSAPLISHSRNVSPQGSQNDTTNSEIAAAIALSLETLVAESTVPAAENQEGQSGRSSLQEATQEAVDPDNMTYEELQALGDAIGTESNGLSKELIASFPTQKLEAKSGWFASEKSKPEECVICIMEYETGDELVRLPCLHLYHKNCITRWLTDKKTCPVCNTDLSTPPNS